MKKKNHPTQHTEPETAFKYDSDICQQLMSRYSSSKAVHHRHLLATAAAIRSIISSDNNSHITPSAYFAAAINNLSNHETLDSTAIAALLSLVSILVPLISEEEIESDKASDAVKILVAVVERDGEGLTLGAASVSCVVKCLGALIVKFSELGHSKLGFQTLLKFSVDRRPKVRKCAHDCIEKVFKSVSSSSNFIKESSKLVLSMLKSYMTNALTLSELEILDASNDEILAKPGNLEVLHVLNLLKLVAPYLSVKTSLKVFSELVKLISPLFSPHTRHVFRCLEALFESSREVVIGPYLESIIDYLCSYASNGEKNPVDTAISAANLLKIALDKLSDGGSRSVWMKNIPKVFGSLAGLLTSEATTASQASCIMKEMIRTFTDEQKLLINERLLFEAASQAGSAEVEVLKSTCKVFENILSSCNGVPNEHLLDVVSALLLKLREVPFIITRNLVLILADLMNNIIIKAKDKSELNHLEDCIGSAVIAFGPERVLTSIPILFQSDKSTCSNVWLIAILEKHVVGASLGYYIDHIAPLAKSFMQASKKVKKSVIGQELQAYAHGLWGLLPAFCHYPVDIHRKFGSLSETLITFLKEDSFMHQNVAVALQALVNQNKSAANPTNTVGESQIYDGTDTISKFRSIPSYSKKTAMKNIKALSSHAQELLQALVDIFVDSPPEKRLYIKDAVGCLASITDSSVSKSIFVSLLERYKLVKDNGDFEHVLNNGGESIETELACLKANEREDKRCVIMELASVLIEGAKEDFINLIYNYAVFVLKDTVWGHCEAYETLSRILKEQVWFCASRSEELIDFLIGFKPPAEVASLRNRFACFHMLMIHTLEECLEEENPKAFLMLNEIIITSKDAKNEARKVAYEALVMISSSLRGSSSAGSGEPYHKLISMIMGYLSGPSPQIKSGAVSALSLLLYNDPDICLTLPEFVPSLLSLLQSKAVEVIKAVLGFVKVLVSSLQANDLKKLVSDITSGILLWSTVSRFHFRSKVTVILEIMIRKCGSAAVELVTPEKHKSFVKNVLQNRHHKPTSGDGSTDVEIKLDDSSSGNWNKKRKHKELDSVPVERISVHKRKRERENKVGRHEGAKRIRGVKYEKPLKGLSADNLRRKFIKESAGGLKKRAELKNMKEKNEMLSQKSVSKSKFRKQNKLVTKLKEL